MITHVAIIFQNKTYSLPAPNRHHHIHAEIVKQTGVSHIDHDIRGFLDESGKFYDRRSALIHAVACGQIKVPKFRSDLLFSEDIW